MPKLTPPPTINLEINLSDARIIRMALELVPKNEPAMIKDRVKYLINNIMELEKYNLNHIPEASKKVERVADVDKTMIEKLTKEASEIWERCQMQSDCYYCSTGSVKCVIHNNVKTFSPDKYTKEEYIKEYIRSKTDE